MDNRVRMAAFVLVGLTGLMTPHARAQKKDGVIRLEVTTIEGRVQKPNAFFINTRQGNVYETMEVRESFVPEIIKVVEDGEF